jgi:Flp pilus assembly protein TadG
MSWECIRKFSNDTSGAVFVYTAAALAVLLGMAGLAVDVGYWYWSQRDIQSAADSAAMSAALEIARGATPAEIEARARDSASLNGYQHGGGSILVTINRPPASGAYAGDNNYIEAIVQQDQGGFVSSVTHSGDMTIAARAVATLAGAPSCVIALNPAADDAIGVTGNGTVTLDCGAQSNSNSPTAIDQIGNSSITAESIQTVGGYGGNNYTPMPQTGMPPVEDPFAYLNPPTVGPCDEPNKVTINAGNHSLDPGVYCGGLEIRNGNVDLDDGLYILDGVGLQITGGATVTGDNVTIFIPATATGSMVAGSGLTIFIAGTATVTLTAPTTGPYDGILFYQDPASDPALGWRLIGGSDMSLGGVLYAPNQDVEFMGDNAGNGTPWTALIADEVDFVGDAYLSNGNFGAAGVNLPLALSVPSLAE